jgi:hypothetical protein
VAEVADDAVSRSDDRRRIRMPSRIRHSSTHKTFETAVQGVNASAMPELPQVAISCARKVLLHLRPPPSVPQLLIADDLDRGMSAGVGQTFIHEYHRKAA